jgi:hypothetical protein
MTTMQPQSVLPVPDGSVIITPAQMYTELREMRTAVERLTSTVDPALQDVRSDVTALQLESQRNGNRVTIVETQLKAAWAVLALLIGALAAVAGYLGH